MDTPYDFELDYLSETIGKNNHKRILIQLPNGLKKYYKHIVDYLKKQHPHIEIIVSLSATYGACDIAEEHAKRINADLLVHIGHNMYPWYKPKINTVFIEAKYKYSLSTSLLNNLIEYLKEIKCKNVGILSVIQHSHNISELKNFLSINGFNPIVGSPKYNVMVSGQVLGCEYSAAIGIRDKVDCFTIISGGMFHALGVYLATTKRVVKIDPYENKIVDITEEGRRLLMKRYGILMKATDTRTLGIIDGGKPGQHRPWLVKVLSEKARTKDIKTYVFIADELNRHILRNIDLPEIDAYTIVSCPRLPIDDLYDYEKPVLTPGETLMILTGDMSRYIFPW